MSDVRLGMETTIAAWAIALLLVLIALAGLVIPGLPGPPLLFAGLWLAAWAEDFAYVGFRTLILLGFLAALLYVIDFAAAAFGARTFGGSNRALAGAAIGLLLGLFLGFPGIIVGPFIGAVVAELTALRDIDTAMRAGLGATIGLAIGVALKFALAFSMIGIFALVRIL